MHAETLRGCDSVKLPFAGYSVDHLVIWLSDQLKAPAFN
jgi:hypothetical protein